MVMGRSSRVMSVKRIHVKLFGDSVGFLAEDVVALHRGSRLHSCQMSVGLSSRIVGAVSTVGLSLTMRRRQALLVVGAATGAGRATGPKGRRSSAGSVPVTAASASASATSTAPAAAAPASSPAYLMLKIRVLLELLVMMLVMVMVLARSDLVHGITGIRGGKIREQHSEGEVSPRTPHVCQRYSPDPFHYLVLHSLALLRRRLRLRRLRLRVLLVQPAMARR